MARQLCLLWAYACVCFVALGLSKTARGAASERPDERRYLVRFSTRLFQTQQAEFLRNVTSNSGVRHRYVHRFNAAAKLPSAHAVIKSSASLGSLQELLMAFPEISGVSIDASLRSLAAVQGRHGYVGGRVARPLHQRLLESNNHSTSQSPKVLAAELGHPLHAMGFRGNGIKVAVFDTGLGPQHHHFKKVKERTNWTNEKTLVDTIGHGTFVAGVIASTNENCPGIAPEVDLYVFRIFTKDRVSYTSWFLDAFNYAMFLEVDVLNLSIGGPDYLDQPFVDKVNELSASGVVVVSAIGNDGPVFGTLNNPADQADVVGVGGIDSGGNIASFSSRGMTLRPLIHGGYGQVKPDVVTKAQSVVGSAMDGGCRELSGTSMASPVVTGAIALLIESIPASKRQALVNPAAIKQLLHASARPLASASIFEQGAGEIDLARAQVLAQSFVPHVSIFPPKLSNSESSCPQFWPWCQQPLYHTSQPLLFNLTLLNSVAVTSRVIDVHWAASSLEQRPILEIEVQSSEVVWPWSGWLALSVRVSEEGSDFSGLVQGNLTITVSSVREGASVEQHASVALEIQVIPTPPRNKRLLWDQFHSLHYPSPYVPRDNLKETRDTFDWNGDHPHTNFAHFFNTLRSAGYFVEVLGHGGWDCFDASNYAALLLVDPEDDFDNRELLKLQQDIRSRGLGLFVVAEWHEESLLPSLSFFDDNTRSAWFPVVAGANVPALNRLLRPFGGALGDGVVEGSVPIADVDVGWEFASGSYIARWPVGGQLLMSRQLTLHSVASTKMRGGASSLAALGLFDSAAVLHRDSGNDTARVHGGRIAVMADSHCLDTASMVDTAAYCGTMAVEIINYLSGGDLSTRMSAALQEVVASPYSHGTLPVEVNVQNYSNIDAVLQRTRSLNDLDKRMLDFARYSKYAKLESGSRCFPALRAQWITRRSTKPN